MPALPLTETQIRAVIEEIPLARALSIRADLRGDELTLILPYAPVLIGNQMLPALHGGAIGAFIELAAVVQISVAQRQARLPRTVDIDLDFLRSGRPVDTYARAQITRLGRRVAHVRAEAWQDVRAEPIALMRGNFRISPAEPAAGEQI